MCFNAVKECFEKFKSVIDRDDDVCTQVIQGKVTLLEAFEPVNGIYFFKVGTPFEIALAFLFHFLHKVAYFAALKIKEDLFQDSRVLQQGNNSFQFTWKVSNFFRKETFDPAFDAH